jgi:lysosomal acid lipase/cholesteryl ester hydrolase
VITPKGLKNETASALIRSSPDLIFLIFGRRCLLSSAPFWASTLSRETFASVIDLSLRLLFAWDCDYLPNRHIVYRHLYSYSSVKIVAHWFQIIQTGRISFYDEMQNQTNARFASPLSNIHYSTPKYPTEDIGSAVPIALLYGGKDTLLDMDALLERLSVPPAFCLEVSDGIISTF